eukprot:Gregarina_sp_Poly_1__1236@NODE_12_length_23383_cov_104_521445_g10_i0_p10_GENE_NODE_12_length_23383_cov_104_521445_g10_i0NODE_12_length_23383_cov_104_521445_g10_i0_p10_ORF_typecomplete_len219_score35_03Maf/PF02545_14/5_2e27SAM_4/PF18017_1/8_7e03SAM_4/PF18017_1/0_3SAM_4/PF18017_1/1_6e03_NODE_12_length_23383_cov_104_521445_g10_i01808818744
MYVNSFFASKNMSLLKRTLRVCCGSSSVQRQSILNELGFSIAKCAPANIDEHKAVGDATHPEEKVKRITAAKTDECLKQLSKEDFEDLDVLVTGDILVVDQNGNMLGKPACKEEACDWLRLYNEQKYLYTVQALEVTNLKSGKRAMDVDWVMVKLNSDLPESEFENYLEFSGAMKAAGAMIVECDWFMSHIEWLRGEVASVRGLSCKLFKSLLFDILN